MNSLRVPPNCAGRARRCRTADPTRRCGLPRRPTTSCRDWRGAGLPSSWILASASSGGALPDARGRARPACAAGLSSLRRRIATSALSARLGTETLIMKVSSSRNDSFSRYAPNGPACSIVAQTAKPDRISATVAVSRGPRRSAARAAAGWPGSSAGSRIRCAHQRAEGDHADGHGDSRAPRRYRRQFARPNAAPVGSRPQHDHRRDHQRAGDVAQPPGHPDRAEFRPVGKAGDASVATPMVALMTVAGPALNRRISPPARGWQRCRGRRTSD